MISDTTVTFANSINKVFNDPLLLEEALTHKSWSAENKGTGPNEKLEFLGDSVLGLIVTEHIYTKYPELAEGQLSLLRSVVVGRNSLKEVAEEINLDKYLKLGNASISPGLLEDAVEAVIGAIYLDGGWLEAKGFVIDILGDRIEEFSTKNNEDKIYEAEIDTKVSTKYDEINEKYLIKLGSYGLFNRLNILKSIDNSNQ